MTRLTLQADLEAIGEAQRLENLEIATLTVYDVPALAALSLIAYNQKETAENLWEANDQMHMAFEGAFGTPRDDSFIGAWLDGQLVGAILAVLDPPWDGIPRGPFVSELMVDPEFRRLGVATSLISELAERAEKWGYDSLTLHLDLRLTHGAYELYQELGFTRVNDDGSESF